MKIKNVIFSKRGVRIVNGDYTPTDNERVLVNPEYPKGIAPNYWKLEDNKIIEMNEQEKQSVDLHHTLSKHGYKEAPIHNIKKIRRLSDLKIILISAGISCLINIVFRCFLY